jgi:hypothetical protein
VKSWNIRSGNFLKIILIAFPYRSIMRSSIICGPRQILLGYLRRLGHVARTGERFRWNTWMISLRRPRLPGRIILKQILHQCVWNV